MSLAPWSSLVVAVAVALAGPVSLAQDASTDRPTADAPAADAPRPDATASDRPDGGALPAVTSTAPDTAVAGSLWVYALATAHPTDAPVEGYTVLDAPEGMTLDSMTGTFTWTPAFSQAGTGSTVTVTVRFSDRAYASQTFSVRVTCPDRDRDGQLDVRCVRVSGTDCDDARPEVRRGATEFCNGLDDDCDGLVDETESSSLCSAGEVCDPASRQCRPSCRQPGDCAGGRASCNAYGACSLCAPGEGADAGARACEGAPEGAACVLDARLGVFCGCLTDADCGGVTSGRVCDPLVRLCVDGCSPAPRRNNCPAGRVCTSGDATGARVGECTVPCGTEADCARVAALPRCALSVGRCVACRADLDCAAQPGGRTRCDPESGACVQCTTTESAVCNPLAQGGQCLSDHRCGCFADSDCGGTDSGRICDTVRHACAQGCRAEGQGCPAGARCDAVDAGVGSCLQGDGGVPPDAVTPGDAGPLDARADAVSDAPPRDTAPLDVPSEPVADAGPTPEPPTCDCSVPGGTPSRGVPALIALLAGLSALARRRAPRSPSAVARRLQGPRSSGR